MAGEPMSDNRRTPDGALVFRGKKTADSTSNDNEDGDIVMEDSTGPDVKTAAEAGLTAVGHVADRTAAAMTAAVGAVMEKFGAPNYMAPEVLGQGADAGDIDSAADPVILRVEISSSKEGKLLRFVTWFLTFLAFIATLSLLGQQSTQKSAPIGSGNIYGSIILTAIMLAVLLSFGILFITRLYKVKQHNQVWSRRRGVIATYSFAVLTLHTAAILFSMIGFSILSGRKCGSNMIAAMTLGYCQLSASNGVFLCLVIMAHNGAFWDPGSKETKRTSLIMDAPQIPAHIMKSSIFISFQVIISLLFWRILNLVPTSCKPVPIDSQCDIETWSLVLIILLIVNVNVYILAEIYYAWRTRRDIESKTYRELRFVRMVSGLQSQLVAPIFFLISLSTTLTFAVNISSCRNSFLSWLGSSTLQIMVTCMVVILSFFCMPKIPDSKSDILVAWLQEFSWTYKGLNDAIDTRNKHLSSSTDLRKQPMYCMETAIKLLYFSWLAYRLPLKDTSVEDLEEGLSSDPSVDAELRDEVKKQKSIDGFVSSKGRNDTQKPPAVPLINPKIEHGLAMFDLTDWELIYEPKTDTKALLAWGNNNLLLSFKGTSSMENAITDINFLKCIHPPRRWHSMSTIWGLSLFKNIVRVHRGFYKAWTDHGYSKRILNRVAEIMKSKDIGGNVRILLTGHSLGGALATLAAHEIKSQYRQNHVTIYTYGQPRVGNSAFQIEYDDLVNEHFSVINDQDPVARIPKGWYKRAGEIIRINSKGDIMVKPSFLEMQLFSERGKFSHHMMQNYRSSFMSIIKQQCLLEDPLNPQKDSATALSIEVDLDTIMTAKNMDVKSLQDPNIEPIVQEKLVALKKRKSSQNAGCCETMGCGGMLTLCGMNGKPYNLENEDNLSDNNETVAATNPEEQV